MSSTHVSYLLKMLLVSTTLILDQSESVLLSSQAPAGRRGAQRLVYSADTPPDSEVSEAVWIAITWSGGGGVVTCSLMSQGSIEAEK